MGGSDRRVRGVSGYVVGRVAVNRVWQYDLRAKEVFTVWGLSVDRGLEIVEENGEETFMQKVEALFFPVLAAVVGIGYTVAIFVNNPLSDVLSSPHALILLFIFISIAWFPLRSVYLKFFSKKEDDPSADSNSGEK